MASSIAPINIPKGDLPVLRKLSELSDRQFKALLVGLRDAKPAFAKGQFAEGIAANVKIIPKAEIAAILRVLFVLYWMKDRTGALAPWLAKNVAESYQQSCAKENSLSPKQAERLSSRIKALLSFEKSIAVTAKAVDVMTEHNHTFCRARVLSDIRPVFTDSLGTASAGVIIHTLQIGFHDGGTRPHKEFYVALDTNDIQSLKEVIERAEEKTAALETILKKSNVPYLKV